MAKAKNELMTNSKVILVFLATCCFILAAKGDGMCPKRTDYDSRCKKPCSTNADCGTRTVCICDAVCGMSCVRRGVKCRDDYFKKLARGRVIINGKNHGDVIRYKCNDGYTLTGPSVQTCSGIRKWKPWDQGRPTCSRACPNPGNPKDGRLLGNAFEVGKTIRFRCNPGYEMKGASWAVCLSGLTWSNPSPVCQTKSCGNPVLPVHAEISRGRSRSYLYGDRVWLTCASGYSRIGKYTITCALAGWEKSELTCAPKSCGQPGTPTNGRGIGYQFTYKSVVRYRCNRGYVLVGSSSRRCLENQRWSGRLPQCQRIDCGSTPVLENGRYTGSSTYYGATQTAKCDPGYTLVGSETTKCDTHGWSTTGQEPKCQERPKNCFNPEEITNGKLVLYVIDHGKEVKYECNDGYHLDSTSWQKCNNGLITGTKPICVKDKPKDCSNIPRIQNGRAKNWQVKHSRRVEYDCNSGFTLKETSNQLRCDNGKIEGDRPNCVEDKPKDCYYIPSIRNGGARKRETKHSKRVEYYCNSGYILRRTSRKQLTCENGELKGVRPYCEIGQPGECDNVPMIDNGKAKKSKLKHGEEVEYLCDSGHYLTSTHVQKCDDGVITGRKPTCKKTPGYVGCFDSPSYGTFWTWGESITHCKEKCSNKKYVGFRNGLKKCYCGEFEREVSNSLCDRVCQFDKNSICGGSWKYSVFTTSVNCPVVDAPFNGKTSTSNAHVGTTVTITCDDNYQVEGQAVLKCNTDGRWSHVVPKCVRKTIERPKNCFNPEEITNGKLVLYAIDHGEEVKYDCNDGYHLDSTSWQKCNNGLITGTKPICVKDDGLIWRYMGCYKDLEHRALPKKIKDNFVVGKSFTEQCIKTCGKIESTKYAGLQHSYECFCGDDYSKYGKDSKSCTMPCKDDSTRKCGDVWRNSVYKTGCSKPADPVNGKSIDKWYLPNERAEYQCTHGFEQEGRGQLCDGFNWFLPVPECVVEKSKKGSHCPLTFDDANLEVIASSQEEGAAAIFRCLNDNILEGDLDSKCLNKKWTGTRKCLAPCANDRGYGFVYTSKLRLHGSSAEKNCSVSERKVIYKCRNGTWYLETDIACSSTTNQDCSSPSSIANGIFKVLGKIAKYECRSGYRLSGHDTITCSNNKWNGALPKCILPSFSCKNEVQPPLQALNDIVPNFKPQTFSCIGNNDLRGSAVSLCMKGKFVQPIPRCRKTDCNSCNASSESFLDMCRRHDIVFIGKVRRVEKAEKRIEVSTKTVLKHPSKPSQDVIANMKLSIGKWTLKVDASGDCFCPRVQEGKLYVIYLRQDDWSQNKTVDFAIPIVMDRKYRSQLGHFCRRA